MKDKKRSQAHLRASSEIQTFCLVFVVALRFRLQILCEVDIWLPNFQSHILCFDWDNTELQAIANHPLSHLILHWTYSGLALDCSSDFLAWFSQLFIDLFSGSTFTLIAFCPFSFNDLCLLWDSFARLSFFYFFIRPHIITHSCCRQFPLRRHDNWLIWGIWVSTTSMVHCSFLWNQLASHCERVLRLKLGNCILVGLETRFFKANFSYWFIRS